MTEQVWFQLKPFKPGDVSRVTLSCGCSLEMTADSPPVRAWTCEHGNEIRAVGA